MSKTKIVSVFLVCNPFKKALKPRAKKLILSNVVDTSTVNTLYITFQDFLKMEVLNAIHKSFNFLVPEHSEIVRL